MSVIDKIMNAMHLNPDDDDDITYGGSEYDIDDVEEEVKKPKRHRNREKEEDIDEQPEPKKAPVAKEKPLMKERPHIRPVQGGIKSIKKGESMEICAIKPSSFDDAREITNTLLHGRPVLLNVEGLNVDIAQRIIDFTSGSTYAIGGNLQKFSNYIFVITPANVELSGDFLDMVDAFGIDGLN